jgi:multidrug resistance efflux pump
MSSCSRYSAVPANNPSGDFVKVHQRFPVKIRFTARNDQNNLALLRMGMDAEVESTH